MKTKQVRQDILNQWESLAMGFPKLSYMKKKCFRPYNHMSAVNKTSFFHPKNVRHFNSKLG